ncbi:MAG TPA: hypothetical protein VLJ57_09755, partial [Burkholderiaceae bacterium]|nr:hypothetical protein [Burkholderiaceae bacterium]
FKQLRRVSLRSALCAPTPGLRFSPPHSAPPAGTACREIEAGGVFAEQPQPSLQSRLPARAFATPDARTQRKEHLT